MRVLFCDPLNTQNNFYVYARYLRQWGVDAHVIIEASPKIVPREHLPSWHNTKSTQQDSEWVHYIKLPYFIPLSNPIKYLYRQQKLLSFIREFDIVACSGLAPIWMHWSHVPFVFFSYGSDIDQMAIQGWSGKTERSFSLSAKALHYVLRKHLVLSLKRASNIVLAPYQIPTAHRLGLRNLVFMPHVIDTDLFKPYDPERRIAIRDKVHERYDCDFLAFHPPRQTWVDQSIADCKGNDKVFRAFAVFAANHRRAKLLVAHKGWDVESSKHLVDRLGISSRVVWMDQINKPEMVNMYNAVDVVLDQFTVGVLALVAIEAMSCGTPAISYVNRAPEGMFYPEMPPVVQAHSTEDIYKKLCTLFNEKELSGTIGEAGRNWVTKYCSPNVAVTKYIELFEQTITGRHACA